LADGPQSVIPPGPGSIGVQVNTNDIVAIPIHKTYNDLSFTLNQSQIVSAAYAFDVDWGDGTTTSVKIDINDEDYN
jgi:hypothetical protein